MSMSGAHAAAFFREVAHHRVVWWVRDNDGSPTPGLDSGGMAFPFWSSKNRAQRAVDLWGPEFRAESMPVDRWLNAALPDLAKEELRVGLNWYGPRLTGWDFTVAEVLNRVRHANL